VCVCACAVVALRRMALASSRTIGLRRFPTSHRHTTTLGILRSHGWRLFLPFYGQPVVPHAREDADERIIRTLAGALSVLIYQHYSYPCTGIIRTLIPALFVPHEREVQDVDERDDLGRARRLELRQLALRRRRAEELASGYSQGTIRVLTRYSQGTHEVLSGYSRHTYSAGGYSWGTQEHLRQLARRRRRAEERAEHLLLARVSRSFG
jgi:hypothetical protein